MNFYPTVYVNRRIWLKFDFRHPQVMPLIVCFVKVGLGKACFGYGLGWNHVHAVTAERATFRERLRNVCMLCQRVHRFQSCFCSASIWVDRN